MKEIVTGVIVGAVLAIGSSFLVYEKRITTLENNKAEIAKLEEIRNEIKELITRTTKLESYSHIVSIQTSSPLGKHDNDEDISTPIGKHDFCFLSAVNEQSNKKSACILEEKNGEWSLYAPYANCRATCLKLNKR